jgi:hypothetical protein
MCRRAREAHLDGLQRLDGRGLAALGPAARISASCAQASLSAASVDHRPQQFLEVELTEVAASEIRG